MVNLYLFQPATSHELQPRKTVATFSTCCHATRSPKKRGHLRWDCICVEHFVYHRVRSTVATALVDGAHSGASELGELRLIKACSRL